MSQSRKAKNIMFLTFSTPSLSFFQRLSGSKTIPILKIFLLVNTSVSIVKLIRATYSHTQTLQSFKYYNIFIRYNTL